MDISQDIIKVARTMGARFSLNGRALTHEEALSPSGLLPGIARRADQLSSLCLGYGIGVAFEDQEGAPLGIKVVFDEMTPYSLRMLCLVDVLYELTKNTGSGELTSLDQLLYD
jgi:intracellular multiplication protein IcmS